jgi:hypothetical protein
MRKRKRAYKSKKIGFDKKLKKSLPYRLLILFVILLIILLLILIVYKLIIFTSGPAGGKLGGELGSIGIFWTPDYSAGNITIEDCSETNIKRVWDFILQESSDGITIIQDTKGINCEEALAYKFLEGDSGYLVGIVRMNNSRLYGSWIFNYYGNFTHDFAQKIRDTTPSYVNENEIFRGGISPGKIQGNRSINNISEANNEYHSKFKIENLTWQTSIGYNNIFYFRGNGALKESYIYQNKYLDSLEYAEFLLAPINLTQIENIPNLIIPPNSSYLHLENYFENVGQDEDPNRSIEYATNKIIPANLIYVDSYYPELGFDDSNIIYENFTMNVTLSHSNWKSGANVTTNNFNVVIYGCNDSDEYSDYYTKGTTQNLSVTLTDSCSGNILTEYYCSSSRVLSNQYNCINAYLNSGGVCFNGACVVNTSVNHGPRFLDDVCDYFTWNKSTSYSFDMSSCWEDDDNDSLTYGYKNRAGNNLTISQSGNSLTLTPTLDWNGTGRFSLWANDTNETVTEEVYFIVRSNVTNNTSTNTLTQGNDTNNLALVIQSPSPSGNGWTLFEGANQTFSIENTNYDKIEWYLNDQLKKENSLSYIPEDLSKGNYTVRVVVKKGWETASKTWQLTVQDEREITETPLFDFGQIMFYIIVIVIFIIILLLIWLFIAEKQKQNQRTNNPGFGVSVKPETKPTDSFKQSIALNVPR